MFRQFRRIEPGEVFAIGSDLAGGGGDYSVSQFYSITNFDVPLVYSSLKLGSEMISNLFPVLEKIADLTGYKPLIGIERQFGGLFEAERLAALNRKGKFEVFKMPVYGEGVSEEGNKYGWDTNSATRPEMLQNLKTAIDKRVIKVYDKQTIEECYSFIESKTSSGWKAQAERNAHDDHVMSLAIALKISHFLRDVEELRLEPAGSGRQFEYASRGRWR
jgi:hypothetical protein